MRTSASPGPGWFGSAISIRRNDSGFSSWMAFMKLLQKRSARCQRQTSLVRVEGGTARQPDASASPKGGEWFPLSWGRGPGCTAIELGACCSKHDFFDPPLKMIRPIQRQFRPGRFALGAHADRRSDKHELELFHHRLDRKLAVKQVQQLILQRVIRR